MREFLDLRTQKWATFAAVWNEVINNMRYSDVISNAEQGILKFHSFAGFAKPVRKTGEREREREREASGG